VRLASMIVSVSASTMMTPVWIVSRISRFSASAMAAVRSTARNRDSAASREGSTQSGLPAGRTSSKPASSAARP
jgi:hypothetical protein